MKNYFDALDRLCESGQPSKSEAISALQGKFPELSANAERAGRIVTAWRSGFGKTHVPQEGYASSEEAEALFLFGDFLRDLASNLACRNSAEKCSVRIYQHSCVRAHGPALLQRRGAVSSEAGRRLSSEDGGVLQSLLRLFGRTSKTRWI